MRELAVLTFQTLDGVMQAPRLPDAEAAADGFEAGDWAAPYWDDVMEQVERVAMSAPYDVLLGRKTYQLFASSFPDAGDEHPMNKAKKVVATSTLSKLSWNNSLPIKGDVATEVARLKREEGPLLQVHGSQQLIQTLLHHGLIDEFRIWTFPVVVGSGRRLFGERTAPATLELMRTEPTGSGAVMAIYRPA